MFRLCRDAGRLDVGRVLRELTPRDLAWWRAWYSLEPRGEERADLHAAILVRTVTNAVSKEPVNTAEVLRDIRDHWTPITTAERQRRKKARIRKAKRKMAANAQVAKEAQDGSNEHRQVVGPGNA